MTRPAVQLVLPDTSRPTGGNGYDRRVADGLADAGWTVRRVELGAPWPHVGDCERAELVQALGDLPDGAAVVVDGIVAGGVPEAIEPAGRRLCVLVLVHLPLSDETGLPEQVGRDLAAREGRTLRAAAAVIVTSPWARRRVAAYGVDPSRVHVVTPGTDPAPLAHGAGDVPHLLCVAAVTPRKDQLTLVDALARLAEVPWTCSLVGPVDAAPDYVAAVRERCVRSGLDSRVRIVGPLTGTELADAYDSADLFVLPSRAETFGMVITEALSRGLPVVTTADTAAAETLGTTADGVVPGLLVPAGDTASLADALRRWLSDGRLRSELAATARRRRETLPTWDSTTHAFAGVVSGVHAAWAPS